MIGRHHLAARIDGGEAWRGRANGKGVLDGGELARGIGEHCLINLPGEKREARDELDLSGNGLDFPQQSLAALGAHQKMAIAGRHHCVCLEA